MLKILPVLRFWSRHIAPIDSPVAWQRMNGHLVSEAGGWYQCRGGISSRRGWYDAHDDDRTTYCCGITAVQLLSCAAANGLSGSTTAAVYLVIKNVMLVYVRS